MYTELYLVSIGFLILEGDNLSNLFPIEEFQVFGLSIGAKKFCDIGCGDYIANNLVG